MQNPTNPYFRVQARSSPPPRPRPPPEVYSGVHFYCSSTTFDHMPSPVLSQPDLIIDINQTWMIVVVFGCLGCLCSVRRNN